MGQSITRNKLAGTCCRAPSTACSAWIKEPCPASSRGACKRCRASWQLWDVASGCSFGIMNSFIWSEPVVPSQEAELAAAQVGMHQHRWGSRATVSSQDSLASPGQCPAELQPCSSSHTAPLAWHCALANTPKPSAGPISQGRHSHAAPGAGTALCALQTLQPLCHNEWPSSAPIHLIPQCFLGSSLSWTLAPFFPVVLFIPSCPARYQHLWPCPSGYSPSSNVPAARVKTQFAYPSTNGTIWSLISTLSFHGFALLTS